jgi:ankyrin repeat protein
MIKNDNIKKNKQVIKEFIDIILKELKKNNGKNIKRMISRNNIDINMVDEERMTALHHAAKLGNDKIIELLLDIKELDVNKQGGTQGLTALHYASSVGCIKCVKLLLNHQNININVIDKFEDLTPLD